jgi:RNA polymerase sigma factor (sigma-70 family)
LADREVRGVDLVNREKRNELALAHIGLVRQRARRLTARVPRRYDEGDLCGWGMLALLRALEQYDERRGEIGPYLACKIDFGIFDGLRDAEHSRRNVRPVFADMDEAGPLADTRGRDASRSVLSREVWDAVEGLPVRWRIVMRMYYQHELTLRECGEAIGVNESRASQIHTRAVRELRGMLTA